MGGAQCGEVASAITCEVLQREIAAGADLNAAVTAANDGVLAAVASGRGNSGMASTVVAARLAASDYELAWVGDSRVYLWDGKLHLLSRDHSFVEQELASGRITREEARTHPRRHVILQAIGTVSGQLDIGANRGRLAPGNCLLLCSDGITDALDSPRLCELLGHWTGAQDTCQRLVEAAFEAGGKDNITALLVANTRRAQDAREGRAPEHVVWVYDPKTARYEDPHGPTVSHPSSAQEAIRAAPPAAASPTPPSPGATTPHASVGARARHCYWLAALLGALALVLAWAVS